MIKRQRNGLWLLLAFIACYFAGGAFEWRGSYLDYLKKDLPLETLLLLGMAALLMSLIFGVQFGVSAFVIGSAYPAIVFTRVVLDGMKNPRNHNLWPFEIALAIGLAMGLTLPFAGLGALLHRFLHRGPGCADHPP
jgi:hypothetical protein